MVRRRCIRLLDRPLLDGERIRRLGDAAMRAPSVFGVEQHVVPRLLEPLRRITRGIEHRPERFGLHEPLGTGAVHRGLGGGRAGAVLPVRRPVAAHAREFVAVAILERAERLAGGRDDELRPAVRHVPFLDEITDGRVGHGVVALVAGPADVGDVVVEIAFLQRHAEVVNELGRHRPIDVRHRITKERHPNEHLAVAVRADPPEGLALPLRHRIADPAAFVRIDAGGKIPDARLGHRRDRAPGVARHVADHRRCHRHARAFAELGRVTE